MVLDWTKRLYVWALESLTLLTVNALISWTTYADSLNAGAMVGAGGVNALTFLHITLCPLPPHQTHTSSFLIHPVPAAQHWAWICRTEQTQIRTVRRTRMQTLVAAGYEPGDRSNLLWEGLRSLITARPQIQQIRKPSGCSLSHAHTHSHMHVLSHKRTIGLIPSSVSIFSSTTWAWLPRQPRNRRKSPPNVTSLPLNRPWKQSWKR